MKALKKVPSDKKGLSKLPTAVRNKMGYMKGGGKVKKKGMTTAERKNQYMDSIKDKQKKDQSKVSQKNKIRLMAGYGSNRFVPAPITEKMKYADKGVKNLAANREQNVYKPARESASKRFDKATKYDELLGRATNPDKYEKGGKVYKTGGKAPVDPPTTSPESKSSYNIGNMSFKGEEADRLIAFNEHLDKDFSNLDLFQKTEQIEKFINSKGHKSSEAMKAYNVDPALKKTKAPSIEDTFESSFGESSFGGSDPFDDDPDIQRMREEAASSNNRRGRRKKFNTGGAVVKKYKKGGKVFKPHNMYKDGKVVKAKTMEDHLRLKKQGYSHKKA
jgi:hypothetical protein